MQIDSINVFSLANTSELSLIRCADLSEAAAVGLDYHAHGQGDIERILLRLNVKHTVIHLQISTKIQMDAYH